MPDQAHRTYLFVAIDRATRWIYVEIKQSKSAASAKAFLNQLIKQARFNIKTLLTDNDKAFTDRVTAQGNRTSTGDHLFDQLCATHAIDHRLIPTTWCSGLTAELRRSQLPPGLKVVRSCLKHSGITFIFTTNKSLSRRWGISRLFTHSNSCKFPTPICSKIRSGIIRDLTISENPLPRSCKHWSGL